MCEGTVEAHIKHEGVYLVKDNASGLTKPVPADFVRRIAEVGKHGNVPPTSAPAPANGPVDSFAAEVAGERMAEPQTAVASNVPPPTQAQLEQLGKLLGGATVKMSVAPSSNRSKPATTAHTHAQMTLSNNNSEQHKIQYDMQQSTYNIPQQKQMFQQQFRQQSQLSIPYDTRQDEETCPPPPQPHPTDRLQRRRPTTACATAAHKCGQCNPCRHFLRGKCDRKECNFCHHDEDLDGRAPGTKVDLGAAGRGQRRTATPHEEDLDPWTTNDPWASKQHQGGIMYPVFEWEEDAREDRPSMPENFEVFNHSANRLEGMEGLLVDTGSKDNLTGGAFVERQSEQAKRHGHLTRWEKLTKPKLLSGVGRGQEECTHQATVPGALQEGDLAVYKATVLQGEAAPVPRLYGLEPMAERNTFVGTRTGYLHEVPIGMEHLIRWPQGTVHRRCVKTRSGHWCLPVSYWQNLKQHSHVDQAFPTSSAAAAVAPGGPSPPSYQ